MLFFLYGEDNFRSLEKVLEIKNKFSLNDKSGSGLSLFDASESKESALEKMRSALSASGLFSSKKLIILKKIIAESPSDEQAKILKFLKENSEKLKTDSDSVIIFWEENVPRKNNALFKFLLEQAKKQNFEKLTGIKLNQWVLTEVKKANPEASTSKEALEKLIAYVGNDTALLTTELGKLISYSQPEIISAEAVDLLTKANLDNNIFETIEALSANRKQKALELFHRHLDQGDDPFYLFSMFVYQFRNLLRIASLQENGIFSEFEIAKLAKIHPFVVKKSFAQARNFGEKKLITIHKKLGALDTKIKTGQADIKLSLDKFIVEL
ncbi:MAG: DNA polymerase III subunit delta [Candidatus Moranbacteria bacterium]|nr:DNA polymerase III subunit delta [Candidatus Moranbacteria bacterium]